MHWAIVSNVKISDLVTFSKLDRHLAYTKSTYRIAAHKVASCRAAFICRVIEAHMCGQYRIVMTNQS